MPHDLQAPRIVVASGMAGTGVTSVATQLQRLAPRLNVVEAGHQRTDILEACTPGFARLLAVTTNDVVAVTSTYALIKLVRDRFPESPIEIVVNRCDARDALKPYERIQGAAMHFLRETVGFGGSIPDAPTIDAGTDVDDTEFDIDNTDVGAHRVRPVNIDHPFSATMSDDSPVVAAIGNIAARLDEELESSKGKPAYSAERRSL